MRTKGTGSIYKDKRGYWFAQIATFDDNGNLKYKRFSSLKKKDVIEKLEKYKLSIGKGEITEYHSINIYEYINNYVDTYKKTSLKPSAFTSTKQVAERIKKYIGQYDIDQLTNQIIQTELINKMIEDDYSYSSIHKSYILLNEALKKAIRDDLITKNACDGVTKPSKKTNLKRRVEVLDEEEIRQMFSICDNYHNGRLIMSIIYTGLRAGELCGIKWSDIDFDNRTLNVNKNIVRCTDENGKYYTFLQEGVKTNDGRVIPLNDSVIKIFKDEYDKRQPHKDEFVLLSQKGGHTNTTNISHTYNWMLKCAGIDGKTGIHTLRHTCASLLIKNNVDAKVVSEILGHKDVAFTYNIYVHLFNSQKAKAVNLIDYRFE